ncbi:MAG: 3-ketoacyl-ACP reductase [Bacteroidales bacterium]|nr:3-ketoacyl-ACP reductase [Bacteroidales bacterium]
MRQVALITGGTRGIGLGISRELALKGFDLALNGMRPDEQVQEVLDELRESGGEVIYCRGNVSVAADREQMLKKVLENYGRLNLLVNNAGMAPRKRLDILETTVDSYHEVMNVNLGGPFFLTQLAANYMIAEKQKDPDFKSAIVNISSISATLASVNRAEYCISKAGMSMMTQLFAVRLGEYDIPVFEVRPGVTQTDMTSGVKEKYDRMIEEGLTLQKRWGYPADVGRAVASLAEGDLAYSTGQVIMVDGGLTIGRL